MSDFGRHQPTNDYDEALSRHGKNYHGNDGGFFPQAQIRSNINRKEWNCDTQGHRPSNTIQKFCLVCDKDL